ncbi:MAG: HutD family protein [Pseudomonadota bacterium]
MKWHVIHLADVPATAWKNGGGVTRELAVWPQPADWVWRMSVADVAQDGPFSVFEGIDRWFAVLDGAGVQLDMAGKTCTLTPADPPFFFDGATPVDCRLLAGKTLDFNLMLRRGSASAHMQRVSGSFEKRVDARKIIAVYTQGNGASLAFDQEKLVLPAFSLAWLQLEAPTRIELTAEDALWMEIAL